MQEESASEEAASPSFGDVVGRVDTIVLGRHSTVVNLGRFEHILSEATSLQHFTLNTPEFLSTYLDVVPSVLNSLRIGTHYFRRVPIRLDTDIILPMLLNPPNIISHLQRLCIPEVVLHPRGGPVVLDRALARAHGSEPAAGQGGARREGVASQGVRGKGDRAGRAQAHGGRRGLRGRALARVLAVVIWFVSRILCLDRAPPIRIIA